jgi:hypothetical protein
MIDFNFYPERHLDELEGMLDIELPEGWNVADLIRCLHDTRLQLWQVFYEVDDDGGIRRKSPPRDRGRP